MGSSIPPKHESPSKIVRTILGLATVGTGVMGLLLEGGGRLLVASGAFGVMWWSWDVLMDWIVRPAGEWFEDLAIGGRSHHRGAANVSVDHRIEVLENRLRASGTRRAYVQTTLRLAELYELQKRDRARARAIVENARALYPDDHVLAQYAQRLTE